MCSRQQLSKLWDTDDLIGLGALADAVRTRLHPSDIVTYTTASEEVVVTRVFGTRDNFESRMSMLEEISEAVAFLPLVESDATGVQYLKTLALSRIVLENVLHIQASHQLFGLKVAQIALRFGADDLGVTGGKASEEELRRLIRDAGFTPKQRDALFRSYSLA